MQTAFATRPPPLRPLVSAALAAVAATLMAGVARAQVEPPPPVAASDPRPAAKAAAPAASAASANASSSPSAASAASAASAPEAAAAPGPRVPPPGRTADPLWELGAFAFDAWQPAYPGSDTHLVKYGALPYAVYRGKVVRLESGQLGLRAVRTPRYEWDMTGAFAFGGGANKVRARADMPTIGTLAQAGPMLRVNLGPLDQGDEAATATALALPVRAVFDLNDSFRTKGWTFEPTLAKRWWRTDASSFTTSLGMLWASRRMGQLFYGVSPEYATSWRPAYDAKGGLIATRLSARLSLRVTPTLRAYAGATLETVRGAANESSPLVLRKQDIDLGIGLVWIFRRSEEFAAE